MQMSEDNSFHSLALDPVHVKYNQNANYLVDFAL